MIKFETKNPHCGYRGYHQSQDRLIDLGGSPAIVMMKRNSKSVSFCYQNDEYFDYHGIRDALIPNTFNKTSGFTPKRIQVIQMKDKNFSLRSNSPNSDNCSIV